MPGYVVLSFDITDLERFRLYLKDVLGTIRAHDGRPLTAAYRRMDGYHITEGEPREATVVIEFPSVAAAEAWHHSPEYQAILPHRLEATEGWLVVADGYEMPD